MMSKAKTVVAMLLALGLIGGATIGCNTVKGAGKDLQGAAEGTEKVIKGE